MAKTDGTQNIPSELLFGYQGALGEERPDHGVRKRYPFRHKPTQTEVGHPTEKQLAQRQRFLDAVAKFNALSQADRERWYATMPEWGSTLWYYNWFMLNAIPSLWGVVPGGAAILKSIQFKTVAMPGGAGEGQIAITEVDPNKCVVMFSGNSYIFKEAEAWAASITVYPYISSIAAELVKCKWSVSARGGDDTEAANIGIIVIEYI